MISAGEIAVKALLRCGAERAVQRAADCEETHKSGIRFGDKHGFNAVAGYPAESAICETRRARL